MPLFYTGKGDKGSSSIGKKRIPKDNPIVCALGDLDELNSFVGFARAFLKNKTLSKKLERVQQDLFIIQAETAWFLYPKFKAPKLKEERIRAVEKEIDEMERKIQPERSFVLPGSNTSSALLHVLRSVARRSERSMFIVSKKKKVSKEVLTYLNRLSSYLYALARMEAHGKKIKETKPTYK
ncbi:MAG: ATP:cob(I)alamin adenosyltransferase [Candidatus Wildermuthbacteria bacterium RIFCSPHIGHO2_01_FULL_48_25]|uniref:Corrinoid adenosyltransferase n=2 Tax=Parcubacteria group TaxID=1794811 RepID=A0A1F8HA95_9BACT|nr:MAG: ATP:cob(I)alamin adenosyltransferase [Candidatus Yanofskybacteria bacterium RIFCSPLOWO2_02_FULL_47_9b]OHA64102.1 MAG: ATP:cob(I)alamin adenosyltransferase [Candidatus Wildermuthbacteria bacterium RIFCSPHIGHO2_01_FULL_48_25]OHA69121.1 MAG: ATP:cob(I)alamin adenosyltransferase [Candidatus Wildermuthbacteria bacterium RIFCSPHIGHO2_02_FULL_49_12b]OHA73198.1 MAG: ATP:cob(I)alamin adenosyltransferase [Candidatus Wildermuthbacteria bacterium RIFCSPLOWO2_01_FULL_48_16]